MAGLSAVPWIAVAIADLQNVQAGPLVVAMQSTATAVGQTDPITPVIAQVSDEVIGAIGFSGRYLTDATQGTLVPNLIPPNLKDMVVMKVVRKMRGRLNMILLPDQIQDEQTYQRTLSALRKGEYPIDVTNNPSGSNISVNPGTVALNPGIPRRFTPFQLRNL